MFWKQIWICILWTALKVKANCVGSDFVDKLIIVAEIAVLLFLVTKNMKMTKIIKILKKQKSSTLKVKVKDLDK